LDTVLKDGVNGEQLLAMDKAQLTGLHLLFRVQRLKRGIQGSSTERVRT
jgi:hypothetical protein